MSEFTELVKLALKQSDNGKIPGQIPDHYVKWCLTRHKAEKGLKFHTLKQPKIKPIPGYTYTYIRQDGDYEY